MEFSAVTNFQEFATYSSTKYLDPTGRRMRMSLRRTSAFLAIGAIVLTALVGCSPGAQLVGDGIYAANTSDTFRENRVYFLGAPEKIGANTQGAMGKVDVRPLHPIFTPPVTPNDAIKHGDPISVLVSSVRIPESVHGPIDIAVVLDVMTGGSAEESKTTLVVWYQRDAHGGMTLGFQNILVYSDDAWDSDYPPFFRIRLLDVKTERNTATATLLDGSNEIASTLGDLVPSPVIPAVNLAIKAAKLILANQKNKVIIDYTVQFYSQVFVAAAGDRADIASLQRGAWMVVGLPKGHSSRFWRKPLIFDRQTKEIFDRRAVPPTPPADARRSKNLYGVQAPYVTMTVVPYSAQVYSLVQQRSEALLRIITTSRESDLSRIDALGDDLSKSVKTFVLLRTLRRDRSMDAVDKIIQTLKDSGSTVDQAALKHELRRVLPAEGITLLDDTIIPLETWWGKNRSRYRFDTEQYKITKKD